MVAWVVVEGPHASDVTGRTALHRAVPAGTFPAQLGPVVLVLIRSRTYGQQIQTGLSKIDELVPFMNRLRDAIDRYRAHPQTDGHRHPRRGASVGQW